MPSTEKTQQAAALLVAARRAGTLLQDLPTELVPTTLAAAYDIQYDGARLFGPIGGWKVGQPKGAEESRATPIPAAYVVPSGGRWPATGPTRIEVELALKLGTSLPRRSTPYQRAEVLQAIASAHIAFEVLGARFVDRRAVSPLTLLADGQSNGGLVVGAVIANWTTLDLATLDMALKVDGQTEQTTQAGTSLDDTLAAVVWLANHAADHVGGLVAGQVILTGARIGPTAVPAQKHIEAQAGSATVSLHLG